MLPRNVPKIHDNPLGGKSPPVGEKHKRGRCAPAHDPLQKREMLVLGRKRHPRGRAAHTLASTRVPHSQPRPQPHAQARKHTRPAPSTARPAPATSAQPEPTSTRDAHPQPRPPTRALNRTRTPTCSRRTPRPPRCRPQRASCRATARCRACRTPWPAPSSA